MRHKFLSIPRETLPERTVIERIHDYKEYASRMEDGPIVKQAERCMDCGTPFCHVGDMIGQETIGCPIHNLIPEWNKLVSEQDFRRAYERLMETNNFPEFTGRVCPAPCEGSCTLGISEDPVAIKSIERTIIDRAFEQGWVEPRHVRMRTGYHVAIIGSGPAGLAAADQLNQAGHVVTVFEKADEIGGLLFYGIPNMKLDKDVVRRRVQLLEAEGIRFKTGVNVGTDVTVESLRDKYDAVILATGAQKQRTLGIEGDDAAGVEAAMDYLTASTRELGGTAVEARFEAAGKEVIVIGGGDTGADCVATAIRQGAKSVTQFGKHPEKGLFRAPDRPWPLQPDTLSTDYAYAEAIEHLDIDPRTYLIRSNRIVKQGDRVVGIETERMEKVVKPDGQATFFVVEGSKETYAADLVLVAIGFERPEPELRKLGVESKRDYVTNLDGVFVAGDARRGQSLIVWAIREGREVAEKVDAYLNACQTELKTSS
ncbi:glutamate synthase subunit beta [Exiguobacterium aurantiacum]|uniref:Glutamate synthase [NADPH] small chain n=1 Tax=Exiguobacterium aurantiacum TaxID=33987 RepID=A0A377FTV7_9BACL|nr:glutamate synthase subunit beta [Exiguobacterium aurantiacum]STO08259.1 Glutamate synthase [NADPH] small chain [Exiguobacterium aurantiacum]